MNNDQRLVATRAAADRWSAAKPRTAKRNQAAQEAILGYRELDDLLQDGAPLPQSWSTTATLPTADEVADALVLVGMMMPIEQAHVLDIARAVVKVMTDRRSPR